MISFSAKILVFAGALILAGAMVPTRRLIARMPDGAARGYWYAMLVLVLVFLVGYLGYAWASWNSQTRLVDLLVPCVFFLGACFVWLTAVLSLRTAMALLRLSLLEQENIADALTGVFNRRYLDRRLNEEVTRASRHGLQLSILMLDIDHFKQINDRHGHPAGDQVLVLFAELVRRQLRESDILARYGGEEFMVIAPQINHQGAVELAERLRTHLNTSSFNFSDMQSAAPEIRLTCSIGVATLGGRIASVDELVRSADENLYRAKRDGRNRVNADDAGEPYAMESS